MANVGFHVGLRTKVKDGFLVQAHAVQAVIDKIDKNSVEAAARNLGTLTRTSESIFLSNPLRPGEKGVRQGERQTGNFTFGTLAQGSFTGTMFKVSDHNFGFGWPDIDKADERTKFVWRSLEYGLAGGRANSLGVLHGPGFSRFPENQYLVPTGIHKMPLRFMFTGPDPSSSFLFRNKAAPKREPREGAGFEGKHFIEDGFTQSLEIMAGRYKKAVLDPVAAFGKK